MSQMSDADMEKNVYPERHKKCFRQEGMRGMAHTEVNFVCGINKFKQLEVDTMAIEKSFMKGLLSDDNKTVEYDEEMHKRLLEAEEEIKNGAELKDAFVFLNEMRAKYATK